LRAAVGLSSADLAAAAPGSGVLYARSGLPIPALTLIAGRGTMLAARRIALDLDPRAPPPVPATLDGVAVERYAFVPLHLHAGRIADALVLTTDPDIRLSATIDVLAPAGL